MPETNPYSCEEIWSLLVKVKEKVPLVHSITNYVVMNTTANGLLAIGASPVMANAIEEIDEISGIADALVLNIGTLSNSWLKSMNKALQVASRRGIPVVLDPVGAGASRIRTEAALDLLSKAEGMILRGNASEIMALTGKSFLSKGVDSSAEMPEAIAAANKLARDFKCTVCVSGPVDLVSDGEKNIFITGGDPMMPKITGMGCTATALSAAFAAAHEAKDYLKSTTAAMFIMSAAGHKAAKKASGPGSFWVEFLDTLYLLRKKDLLSVCISSRQRNE